MNNFSIPEMIPNDYHAINTILVCDLYNNGFFNNENGSWDWIKYSDEQYETLRKKILDSYWFREIGIAPPYVWKHKFISFMNNIMPTYLPMYAITDEKYNSLLVSKIDKDDTKSDNNYKNRTIYSEFPQTMLSGNSDYASNGTDTEDERIIEKNNIKTQGRDYIDTLEKLKNDIYNVDYMIVKRVEPMFSCLLTSYINGY